MDSLGLTLDLSDGNSNKKDTMLIIENDYIPFPGYKCVNLCGILFVRTGARIGAVDLAHEEIHSRQVLELFVIGFYVWYLIEWFIKLIRYGDPWVAYRDLGFEKEAYYRQTDPGYLSWRPRFAFWDYV